MPNPVPLTLEIHDVAFGGKGVARHDGKVYFIPFTIPGEKVTARVTRQKKNFGEAELVTVRSVLRVPVITISSELTGLTLVRSCWLTVVTGTGAD